VRERVAFFVWLFFSLEGRIGRAQWWIGDVLILIVSLPSILATFDDDLYDRYWVAIALFDLAMFYPTYALDSKRFHDHSRSGLWALFLTVPGLLWLGVDAAFHSDLIEETVYEMLTDVMIGSALIILVWFIIELGCLRGIQGANRYGQDPLSTSLFSPPVAA
jgi:uncharacterized membrane protein YhaH (DUF805 family)